MPNPYSYGKPVTDPSSFFGRKAELSTLLESLRQMQSTSVVGLPRIGKSSLLRQLIRMLPDRVDKEEYVPLYISLQDARYRTSAGFVKTVASDLAEIASAKYPAQVLRSSVTDLSGFAEMIQQLSSIGIRPVLCLDEFEALTNHPEEFDDDFFMSLRALGEQGVLATVTTSTRSLAELSHSGQTASPLFNIFIQMELGLLEPEAARILRIMPFQRENISLSPEHESLVEALAGRHPYLIQMACYHLYEALSAGIEPAEWIRERFTQDAEQYFAWLWNYLSNNQKSALLRVVVGEVVPTRETEHTLMGLERLGVVERVDQVWRLFSEAFANWVEKRSSPDAVSRQPIPEMLTDQGVIEQAFTALQAEDPEERRTAAETLGRTGDPAAVPTLLETLKDEDAAVRRAAVEALGKLEAREAISALESTLQDEDEQVRVAAAEALERLERADLLADMPKAEDVEKSIGPIPAAQPDLGRYGEPDGPLQRFEEVMAGISFGSSGPPALTITALVTDRENGNPVLLLPGGTLWREMEVFQPGLANGGNHWDKIGVVDREVFNGTCVAAVARLQGGRTFLSRLPDGQPVTGVVDPESWSELLGVQVCKFGGASGYTEGSISQVQMSVAPGYGIPDYDNRPELSPDFAAEQPSDGAGTPYASS